MAIGERIRFFRNLRRMTQKYLGMKLGFPERSADVRMAQYESEDRVPKAELTKAIAEILDVSPNALTVPDIDSDFGLVHTLFALEDRKLLRIENPNGLVCLRANPSGGLKAEYLNQALCAWYKQYARLQAGEITKEEYNNWRYHYPYHEENKWTYRASRHSGQE